MISADDLRERLSYCPSSGKFTFRKIGSVKGGGPKKVGDVAGCVGERGYIVVRICKKMYYAHRLVWLWVHGSWPENGMDIDHINGNRSDNRIANLRLATRSQNNQNQRRQKRSKSGLKGVYLRGDGLWQSQITPPGKKRVALGVFASKEEAHLAYAKAAEAYFGSFARLE